MMFVGELSVFIVYIAKKFYISRQQKDAKDTTPLSPGAQFAGEKKLKTNASPLIFAIPAAFDFTASTLMFIALTMTPPSIYQMMRGFVTVVVALFSVIFFKRRQHRHHIVGLVCIMAGIIEVGAVAMIKEGGDSSTASGGTVLVGIILILLAQVFAGLLFIVEEYFLGGYYLDPLKVVGSEGMWGFGYFLLALPLMQLVKCSGTSGLSTLCNFGYLENSAYAFAQMADNPVLIVYTFGIMVSIAFFNVCGVTTTKLASAAQRSTVDTSRTVLIWTMSVLLGLEEFYWEPLIGFVFLVFGTLLYNEIIILPFAGFDKNTRIAKEQRAAAEKRDAAYMQASPGAAYSASRNKNLLNKVRDEQYNVDGDEGDYMMDSD